MPVRSSPGEDHPTVTFVVESPGLMEPRTHAPASGRPRGSADKETAGRGLGRAAGQPAPPGRRTVSGAYSEAPRNRGSSRPVPIPGVRPGWAKRMWQVHRPVCLRLRVSSTWSRSSRVHADQFVPQLHEPAAGGPLRIQCAGRNWNSTTCTEGIASPWCGGGGNPGTEATWVARAACSLSGKSTFEPWPTSPTLPRCGGSSSSVERTSKLAR